MRERIGWGLVILGGTIQIVEGFAHADATLNNIQYSETAIGGLLAPLEEKLPVSLGWTLLIAGAGVLWLVPLVSKKG